MKVSPRQLHQQLELRVAVVPGPPCSVAQAPRPHGQLQRSHGCPCCRSMEGSLSSCCRDAVEGRCAGRHQCLAVQMLILFGCKIKTCHFAMVVGWWYPGFTNRRNRLHRNPATPWDDPQLRGYNSMIHCAKAGGEKGPWRKVPGAAMVT